MIYYVVEFKMPDEGSIWESYMVYNRIDQAFNCLHREGKQMHSDETPIRWRVIRVSKINVVEELKHG